MTRLTPLPAPRAAPPVTAECRQPDDDRRPRPIWRRGAGAFGRPATALLALAVVLVGATLPLRSNLGRGAGSSADDVAVAPVMRAVRLSGAVTWQPASPPQAPWRPLAPGTLLHPGDRLRTGPDARAELRVEGEAARLWIDPSTELVVGGGYRTVQVSARSPGHLPPFSAAYLQLGSLWVRVVSGLSRLWQFQIDTPTAVAAVRGTLFHLAVSPDGTTRLYVHEGVVELKAAARHLRVRAGEGATGRPGFGRSDDPALPGFIEASRGRGHALSRPDARDAADGLTDAALAQTSETARWQRARALQAPLEPLLRAEPALLHELVAQARSSEEAHRSGLLAWLERLVGQAAGSGADGPDPGANGPKQGSPGDQGPDQPPGSPPPDGPPPEGPPPGAAPSPPPGHGPDPDAGGRGGGRKR